MESVRYAVDTAREAGCRILLNPAPMQPGGVPDEVLRKVDYLTPNETEVMALFPKAGTVQEAAQRALELGTKVVILTRGSRGVTVFTSDGATDVPACKVNAVDTVGAGDCFSGTLAVALAEGQSLGDAVKFAVAAAALSTTVPGAQEGMPYRQQIEEALCR